MIFKRLRQFQLFVNLKKCQFDIKKIEFLKFIVFIDEIRMNSKRVRTINEWFKSKIYKKVQVFLNFVNFYKRFIYRYFVIAASFIDLLKSNKKDKKSNFYHWDEKTKQAFQQFRNIFSFAFFFIHFDFEKKIKMKTNASNFVVTNILSQRNDDDHWRSITFWSRKLISAEQNYKTHDQELFVIVTTFKQWKHYLKSSAFSMKMWSDHNNLRNFIKQKKLNQKQARWALILIVYDFKIFYKSEKTNSADESSRRLNYEKTSTLNIKLLSLLQNKFALSKSMRNSSKISDDVFEITNVQRFEFTSSARNSKKMLENASMKSNIQKFAPSLSARNSKEMFENVSTKSSVQKFEFSKSIKDFRKMLENAFSKLNVHVNIFIWQESFEKPLMQDNRKTSLWANFVFQLTNIQIVVLKKKVKNLFEKAYDESTRSMKYFIKKF